MIYHVSVNGCDRLPGTEQKPFRTISRAAEMALPGDTVRVHEGVYREWVNPKRGGREDARIVYRSVEPLGADALPGALALLILQKHEPVAHQYSSFAIPEMAPTSRS